MAQIKTPALHASAVPPSSLSPTELADVLAIAGSAQIRAAFASGLASALLPVMVTMLQRPDLQPAFRMAWLAATLLLAISLLCGLATFVERLSLLAAAAIQRIHSRLPASRSTTRRLQQPPMSPREQRVLATSVSSHCALTFAILGAGVACAAWLIR